MEKKKLETKNISEYGVKAEINASIDESSAIHTFTAELTDGENSMLLSSIYYKESVNENGQKVIFIGGISTDFKETSNDLEKSVEQGLRAKYVDIFKEYARVFKKDISSASLKCFYALRLFLGHAKKMGIHNIQAGTLLSQDVLNSKDLNSIMACCSQSIENCYFEISKSGNAKITLDDQNLTEKENIQSYKNFLDAINESNDNFYGVCSNRKNDDEMEM